LKSRTLRPDFPNEFDFRAISGRRQSFSAGRPFVYPTLVGGSLRRRAIMKWPSSDMTEENAMKDLIKQYLDQVDRAYY
jgi:hypothetical protein